LTRTNRVAGAHLRASLRRRSVPIAPAGRLDAARARELDRETHRVRPHVIGESFFKSVVARELRRAERSDLPATVVFVSIPEGPTRTASAWRWTIEALNAAKRETDVIGWFSRGALLGVVLPEIRTSEAAIAGDFEARVRRELLKRMDTAAANRVSIRFHFSP